MIHLYLLTRIKIHIAMQQLALQGRNPREEKQLKKVDRKVRRVQQILVIIFQIRFMNYLGRVKRERIFMRSKSEQAQREDVQLDIAKRAEDRMQKEQDRLQMIADDAIMEKYISHMTVEQQHYYQLRKNTIMAKAMKNASRSNFNV